MVGVSAEVYVCRRMCDETGGAYGVALHEAHLAELLAAHAPPPALLAGTAQAELVSAHPRGRGLCVGRTAGSGRVPPFAPPGMQVSMGFPQKGPDGPGSAVFVGVDARELPGSYACPRWG